MANGKPNRPIRPRGGGPKGRRRVVIDGGGGRPGTGQRQRPSDRPADRGPRQPREVVAPTGPATVESGVTLRDFSQALGVAMPQIIKLLMNLGTMKTATQSLTDDEVLLIAAELEREVTIKHADDDDSEPEVFEDAEDTLQARPPVVTIMGHVDHGKTTLLDAIRQTSVVTTEAGGITQHIGAYQADHDGRRITFLDTPGHEAFTAMRARGAKVTDIAVLVVAADDGVMPQTKESISHARAAEVPIVVAVNKIDLPDANPDRVLSELATEGLQPEEWGGDVQIARVSAKQGEGLDDLLERILLVADAELDLRANPDAEASGPIIESRLDVGRGPVATMLIHRGTLKVGDAIVAGDAWGRVRALYDYRGERIQESRPGEPVEILGFDRPPPAGELGRVVENERRARDLAQQRGERLRREAMAKQRTGGVSLEKLFEQMGTGAVAGPEHRRQGRRAGLGRGDRLGARQDPASRGARERDPHRRRRHHRERRQPRRCIERHDRRLQRAAVCRGARRRRARGRRDPPLSRHLPADRGDRAGARRHALAGRDRGDPRRGRGARALPRVARRHDRRLHGHERCRPPQRERAHLPRGHAHPRDDGRAAAALQGRRPRGDRGIRVRHPARGLQRPARRRRLRGVRDARDRADVARRARRLE